MSRAALRLFTMGIAAGFAVMGLVTATAVDSQDPGDFAVLASRNLGPPLANLKRADLPRDTFSEARPNGKLHEATDIMAPRGTPVLAIGDGTVTKLFLSRFGGSTLYEFDPLQIYCYYYAHLEGYASGIREGMTVHKGDVLGYVGSTGDASPNAQIGRASCSERV